VKENEAPVAYTETEVRSIEELLPGECSCAMDEFGVTETEMPLLGALARTVDRPQVSRIDKLSAIGCPRPSTLWFC
jgi:hypothetical protein